MTDLANHIGLEWNACVSAAILRHSTTNGPEQYAQLLSIDGFLQEESCSDGKHLLHRVSLIPAGHDDNWSRFVPGRLSNQAGKVEAAQVGHFQVQENSVKFFLIDHADRFLAVTDRVYLRLQRRENLDHQLQACEV